jgi:hypothetical protein
LGRCKFIDLQAALIVSPDLYISILVIRLSFLNANELTTVQENISKVLPTNDEGEFIFNWMMDEWPRLELEL